MKSYCEIMINLKTSDTTHDLNILREKKFISLKPHHTIFEIKEFIVRTINDLIKNDTYTRFDQY